MGTSLIGLLPQNTYSGLIKVGNNTALNTTLKTLSDGAGNDLPMQASTTAINFTGTVSGVASGVSGAIQFSNGSAFASDAANFFWDDTNNRLGVGTNAPTSQLEIKGNLDASFQISGGSAGRRALFWYFNTPSVLEIDVSNILRIKNGSNYSIYTDSNGNVGLGTLSPSARTHIVGSGLTSATTSLLVQNSAGTNTFKVQDDGAVLLGVTSTPRNDWALNVGGSLSLRALNSSADILGVYNNTTLSTYINGGGDIRTSGKIGVGSSALMTFQASAKLQIDSTTEGFLPPRMTTNQKNAIASPAEGLQMYDSTAKSPAYYDGTNWGYTGGALQNASGNSGTLNISFAAGNIVNLTLNATTTLAFSNAVIGTYIIQVTQGATGANSLAYPASVKWAGGTAPTLTTTVGKTDILTFYYDGTFYYGTYSLNY